MNAIQALSQLSYSPIKDRGKAPMASRGKAKISTGMGSGQMDPKIQIFGARNVSQAFGVPASNPFRNHSTRCRDEP